MYAGERDAERGLEEGNTMPGEERVTPSVLVVAPSLRGERLSKLNLDTQFRSSDVYSIDRHSRTPVCSKLDSLI